MKNISHIQTYPLLHTAHPYSAVSDSFLIFYECVIFFFPGKNTGVDCHFSLQGIFPTQGLNPLAPVLLGGYFTTEPPGKPIPFLPYI